MLLTSSMGYNQKRQNLHWYHFTTIWHCFTILLQTTLLLLILQISLFHSKQGFTGAEVSFDEGYIDLYSNDINNNTIRQSNDIVVALDLPFISIRGKLYAAAAAVAIHDINNNKNLLRGYRLRYAYHIDKTDTECIEKKAINVMLRQWNMNVSGFLGFDCYCQTVSKISSAVNLPLFSIVSIVIYFFLSFIFRYIFLLN